jgi:hypothetical protein
LKILVAEKSVWCPNNNDHSNTDPPICRAPRNEDDLLTGTLLKNGGGCRLVHSEKTIKKADFEVLIIGKTSCDE